MTEADGSSPETAIYVDRADEFETFLRTREPLPREIWLAIRKKSTGRQTVTLDDLNEVACCFGWVDVKTKRIDDEWYGIRFVPRRVGSNWTPGNRALARRLIDTGRMQPAGFAAHPNDFESD